MFAYKYAYYSVHRCIASNLYHTTKSRRRSVRVAGLCIFFCAKEILYRRYTALGGFSPYESFLGRGLLSRETHQGSVLLTGNLSFHIESLSFLPFVGKVSS